MEYDLIDFIQRFVFHVFPYFNYPSNTVNVIYFTATENQLPAHRFSLHYIGVFNTRTCFPGDFLEGHRTPRKIPCLN